MITINWNDLDEKTQRAYIEFEKEVSNLIEKYKKTDGENFRKIEEKVAQKGNTWDLKIHFDQGPENFPKGIDLTTLLAYEYCRAGKEITCGKVSFDYMADRLFEEQDTIRLGNPVPGEDDEWRYGQSLVDPTAMPLTSQMYITLSNAGAQHSSYYKDGKFRQALFLKEKRLVPMYERDANGNEETHMVERDGMDYHHVESGHKLLTTLRQAVFHELTHTFEKDYINPNDGQSIKHDYVGFDGKKYINYESEHFYVEYLGNNSEGMGPKEPMYFTQKDENGNYKKDEDGWILYFFEDENGTIKNMFDFQFPYSEPKKIENGLSISEGMITLEELPNGNKKMINRVTEGFVEDVARHMVLEIDPTAEIDKSVYSMRVKFADALVSARDAALGKGSTYAIFLTHSSILKQELESKQVIHNR